jgi:2-oxoglutarate dehydrogenase E2 component (dihydrolipoamide succinyltransferase)
MQIEIVVPQLGESILEATVVEWLKKAGDRVAVGDPLLALETSKVNIEVAAEQAGTLLSIAQPAGADVRVGDTLGLIETDAALQPAPAAAEAAPQEPSGRPEMPAKTLAEPAAPATPLARRVAEDLGVNLAQVPGTGPAGRTTRGDVETYYQRQVKPAASPPAEPLPSVRREERVKMSRRRRTIAQRLLEVRQTTAMLTTFNEVDMSALLDLRQRRQEGFVALHGVKLGITSFFVKAAVSALRSFPRLNAEIQNEEIILKHFYDIGVAVSAVEGLVVPVLRDADRLPIAIIEQQIKEFARKAESNSFSLEDLRGGTFTVTNGGVFGSLLSTPILNPPQVAILGLHKIEKRPVVLQDAIAIRPMMYVALSYDHRIVDGMEAVQFLDRIKHLVEEPEALLLEA